MCVKVNHLYLLKPPLNPGFHKNLIEGAYRVFKIVMADTHDNIQLTGTLVDHFYIDVGVCQ